MIGIQEYLEFHKGEIVDFIERKVPKSKDKDSRRNFWQTCKRIIH
jgi:hypothetical protein